ncbi:MAG: hypothetical protein Q7K57_11985 [Burkholderiaceae bacterium]|nr:hypothetical protein [Burkholderiaceae bacterium]
MHPSHLSISLFWRPSPSIGLLVLPLFVLAGCSNVGRTYKEINPEAAAADVRAYNGYEELALVAPDKTKVVLRGTGDGAEGKMVDFSGSTMNEPCRDFSHIGSTQQTGHGVLLPGIAKMLGGLSKVGSMGKAQPFLVYSPIPSQPIQIRGTARWVEKSRSAAPQYGAGAELVTTTKLFCGPLVKKFTPLANHAYVVEFVMGEKEFCSLSVMDATNRDAPVPVLAENITICPTP